MINSMARSLITAKKYYRNMLAGNDAFNPGSFDLISTTILGTDTTSVTFDVSTLAAAGYKHLQVRMTPRSIRSGSANDLIFFKFNGDGSSSNYLGHALSGSGSGVGSDYRSTGIFAGLPVGRVTSSSSSANAFGAVVVDVLDAFSTTKNKTTRGIGGNAGPSEADIPLWSGLWLNTAAITSVNIWAYGGTLVTGSRFSVYGIKG